MIPPEVETRVKELFRKYCQQVEAYRRLGYSNPEYRAREPKLRAYKILLDAGIEPVSYWRRLDETIGRGFPAGHR